MTAGNRRNRIGEQRKGDLPGRLFLLSTKPKFLKSAAAALTLFVTDRAVGAGGDADAVEIALAGVYFSGSVDDTDRLFRTDLDTFAAAATFVPVDNNLHILFCSLGFLKDQTS